MPIPAVEEAVVISDFLDHQFAWLDLVEMEIEKALVNSVTQRPNIFRAAFAGQLVPQDPADEPASALLARIGAGAETFPEEAGMRCLAHQLA